MKILKSSLKKKFKKFTSLHRVFDKFLGCLTPKENNGKQSKPSVGTNAKFPESSTPCLGLRKRKCSRSYARKQIGRISLARRELKRNRRQSWLCFGGGSDSAEWSGGDVGAGGDFGGQHEISIDDEENESNLSSSQSIHRVGHSEENDTQHNEVTEENGMHHLEIEEDTSESNLERQMISSTNALRLKSDGGIEDSSHIDIQEDNDIHGHNEAQTKRNDDKNQKSDDTQHSATSPGIEESSHIDIQDDNDIQSHHEARPLRNDDKNQKVILVWIFVITNFCLEVISSVFEQLSSVNNPNPLYALLAMIFSFGGMLICIVDLVFKGRTQKVSWRWKKKLPWFYYPSQSHQLRPFGTFKDIIGCFCALCQCIVTAINYIEDNKPIKISVWPIIFSFGQLCSELLENRLYN
ncbi:hypothetical protein QYF36_025716 [Acer negundo]|nr:hypothetical protein QYF36_025716 [Acer negundo]